MRVAITAQGRELSSEIDTRFGRTKWLIVVDTKTSKINAKRNLVDTVASILGIQTAQNIIELGVEAIITGNIGPNAFTVLNTSGIRIFLSQGTTAEKVLALFKEGKLNEAKAPSVPTHWSGKLSGSENIGKSIAKSIS